MPDIQFGEKEFIARITKIVEENISSEQFGVSELASEAGMSRSNLLRKIKKITGLSVSLFIRQIRLRHARELMEQNKYTVSEVSYKSGFGSVSYFIKCFHDFYGYPPGETVKRAPEEEKAKDDIKPKKKSRYIYLWPVATFIVLAIASYLIASHFISHHQPTEKSIAVLPFKNDSNDSSNIYIINGLMESVLNNLQEIDELRVISRTSVEKYRNTSKTISEIAKELGVVYFVEGSGQKIGDRILLNIQLIDGVNDRQIWAKQYTRDTKDIFRLQQEVAKKIAREIKVTISPEAEARIDKIPTENPVAYELFLKGRELLKTRKRKDLERAILYFKQAIEEDNTYARAYAAVAIAYYYIDQYQADKNFSNEINYYADKAMLYDSELAQSLIAKALYYMSNGEYKLAASYLEKALKYNPNNELVYVFLVELYANFYPNTAKYLKYALKGMEINLAAYDSMTASVSYLHISNAFIQSGFVEEAKKYINKSLDFNPGNLYSLYVKAYIDYATDKNLQELKTGLVKTLEKDPYRPDIIQEVGKAYYFLRDYKNAVIYYQKYLKIKTTFKLDIYRSEDIKIALVFTEAGKTEEAKKLLADFKTMADNDRSVYKHMYLAQYYSYTGDTEKAIEHLKQFAQEEDYHYWVILFADIDPVFDNIKEMPEFKEILKELKIKFDKKHNKIRATLEEQHVI